MKFRTYLLIFVLGTVDLSQVYSSDLRLPAIIAEHMVLQQTFEAPLWGWAKAGDTVTVTTSWDGRSYHPVTDAKGKWMCKVPTPKAGGPFSLTFEADTLIEIEDVLIGEVWVCSGQSNMQMSMQGYRNQPIRGSNEAVARSAGDPIRLLQVKRTFSDTPMDDLTGDWQVASPETVFPFSAVAYSFGKLLYDALDVPIGLIHSSWGGTPAEAWTDKATLAGLEIDIEAIKKQRDYQQPSVLYNGMIQPLIPFGIRGALWYQGESNRNEPDVYDDLMEAMIGNWRNQWDQGDFPFYFVQIAPFEYGGGANSAYLREAQLKTLQEVPNTGMAVTLDIGEKNNIHPAEKIAVGERLAYWALTQTYGIQGIRHSGPVYQSMEVKEGKVHVTFEHAENGLIPFPTPSNNFEVAGKDRVFHPAQATITRLGLVVWSEEEKEPVAVRYGWKNWLVGDLFNTAGLPASSFRSDDWED